MRELPKDPIQYVREHYIRDEAHQSKHHENLRKYEKLYRGEPDAGIYNIVTRSRYVVPIIYKAVETITPRIISVIFSASPPIQARYRFRPADPRADEMLRNVDLVFERHMDQPDTFGVYQGWVKNCLKYGQAYLKIGWKRRTQEVEYLTAKEGVVEKAKRREIVVDDVDVQLVDNCDLFFSPEAKFPDPFACKHVIHVTTKRRSEILAQKEVGLYGPKGGGEDFNEVDLISLQSYERRMKRPGDVPIEQDDDPLLTIYEYWEDEFLITTCEHHVLLRHEDNPFVLPGYPKQKPFVAMFDTLVPNELFQIGEAEPLEHTQVEMSTLRRQRTDNNAVNINGGFIVDKNADVDTESLSLSRPGMVVGATREPGRPISDVVMPIPRNDISGTSYQDYQELNKDAQDTSGLLDYAVGSAPERRETATTVQLLQTAGNMRFDVKIRNSAYAFMQAGAMVYRRYKQLLTKPIPIRVASRQGIGVEYREITKDDLPDPHQIDLTVPGSPEFLLKDARQQKMMQVYEALKTNPAIPPEAAMRFFVLLLKEAQIDGIEEIITMLEGPPVAQNEGGDSGGGIPVPKPQGVPRPEGRPAPTQVNERPLTQPMPSPNR